MAVRLGALFPRAVIVALLWVLGTAAFTFAADSTLVTAPAPKPPAAATKPSDLIVPSVTGQAYVFAKGILEDAGFAWRVSGPVRGYASNRVVTQVPLAGTRVLDTGAPTIALQLERGPYAQLGSPVDSSPYSGTTLRLARSTAPRTLKSRPTTKPKPLAKPKSKPVTEPKAKAKSKPKPILGRKPAFVVPGAPKEPLDEMTLSARALRLQAWVAHRPKTSANVRHWLYQHAWIVTGAQFGWSRGAQALQTLIAVDRIVERRWGIGAKSAAVARTALARVRRLSR